MKGVGLVVLLIWVAVAGLMAVGILKTMQSGGLTGGTQSGIKPVDEAKQVKAQLDAQQQDINAALQAN